MSDLARDVDKLRVELERLGDMIPLRLVQLLVQSIVQRLFAILVELDRRQDALEERLDAIEKSDGG